MQYKYGGRQAARNLNEYNVNKLTRINWRASLVPAAAVIPAPIAYIKVVAVKKFVVECVTGRGASELGGSKTLSFGSSRTRASQGAWSVQFWRWGLQTPPTTRLHPFTLRKLECSKQVVYCSAGF